MDKKEFKAFCQKEFKARGFKKKKNAFYLAGHDLLCEIDLQKSNFGDEYYINYGYYIGSYTDETNYPSIYDTDIEERIIVMDNLIWDGSDQQSRSHKQRIQTPAVQKLSENEDTIRRD